MENIYKPESVVIELVKSDFDKDFKIKHKEFKYKNGLLIFYAPWCGHCVNSAEMFEEMASLFKNKFTIAALNTYNVKKKNDLVARHFDVYCYPTLKVVKDGVVSDYTGSTSKDDLLDFIIINSQTCKS